MFPLSIIFRFHQRPTEILPKSKHNQVWRLHNNYNYSYFNVATIKPTNKTRNTKGLWCLPKPIEGNSSIQPKESGSWKKKQTTGPKEGCCSVSSAWVSVSEIVTMNQTTKPNQPYKSAAWLVARRYMWVAPNALVCQFNNTLLYSQNTYIPNLQLTGSMIHFYSVLFSHYIWSTIDFFPQQKILHFTFFLRC